MWPYQPRGWYHREHVNSAPEEPGQAAQIHFFLRKSLVCLIANIGLIFRLPNFLWTVSQAFHASKAALPTTLGCSQQSQMDWLLCFLWNSCPRTLAPPTCSHRPWLLPRQSLDPGWVLGSFLRQCRQGVSVLCLHAWLVANNILDSKSFAPRIVKLFSCRLQILKLLLNHRCYSYSQCPLCDLLLSLLLGGLYGFSLQPWHPDVLGFSGPL